MHQLRQVLFFSLTLALAGCATNAGAPGADRLPADVQAILDNAADYELLALDPNIVLNGKEDEPRPRAGARKFHGWDVLGQTTIKDADQRKQVKEALLKGIADSDGTVADCFFPRHGLRVSHAGKTLELVICFQCLQTQIYVDGKQGATVFTTASPQAALNGFLEKAKVPLAE